MGKTFTVHTWKAAENEPVPLLLLCSALAGCSTGYKSSLSSTLPLPLIYFMAEMSSRAGHCTITQTHPISPHLQEKNLRSILHQATEISSKKQFTHCLGKTWDTITGHIFSGQGPVSNEQSISFRDTSSTAVQNHPSVPGQLGDYTTLLHCPCAQ